jgi:hypothetical protein
MRKTEKLSGGRFRDRRGAEYRPRPSPLLLSPAGGTGHLSGQNILATDEVVTNRTAGHKHSSGKVVICSVIRVPPVHVNVLAEYYLLRPDL